MDVLSVPLSIKLMDACVFFPPPILSCAYYFVVVLILVYIYCDLRGGNRPGRPTEAYDLAYIKPGLD